MKKQINDIEVLRAFAVLWVVIHHATGNLIKWKAPAINTFTSYFGGWVGVDLFFAISGFVIARSLLPKLDASPQQSDYMKTTIAFWIRRAWRLLPSAWLWLVAILFLTIFWNESGAFGTLRANIEGALAAFLNIANFRFAHIFMQHPPGASFVYWSLSLEEQFYLLLPLAAFFLRRWLVPIFLLAALYQIFSIRDLWGMSFRTDAILLGVLIAIWTQKDSYRLAKPTILSGRPIISTIVGSILLIALAILGSNKLNITPSNVGVITVVSIILVWLASYNMNLFFAFNPFKPILLWLGSRSYAIYLIHIPAFYATREFWYRYTGNDQSSNPEYFYMLLLSAGLLITVCAELNYRLVETPLRNKGSTLAKHYLDTRTQENP